MATTAIQWCHPYTIQQGDVLKCEIKKKDVPFYFDYYSTASIRHLQNRRPAIPHHYVGHIMPGSDLMNFERDVN